MSLKHDCVQRLNSLLESENGQLQSGFSIDIFGKCVVNRIYVSVEKLDKSARKTPPKVVATYCPFCGKELL